MAYLWENYSEEKEYHIAKSICPYIEVFNQSSVSVNVNPLIRFAEIFEASFAEPDEDRFAFDILEKSVKTEGTRRIINILFHYLAQLDRAKGFDSGQILIEELRAEIGRGLWGEKTRILLEKLTDADREAVLYVLSRRVLDDSRSSFMDAVGRAFPISSLCYEEKTKLYYLYIGSEETGYNSDKLELLKTLFWTVNKDLTVVWLYHYGVVGSNDTMRIGSIQIV